MSKRIFGEKEIKQILSNKNVERCSERSITYRIEFKTSAVRLYEQGAISTEIFKQAGFDTRIIGKRQPKECLRRWNKIVRMHGMQGLAEARGCNTKGRPGTKNISDADKIKRLEAEVAYMKAENDFLAKLRARRAE